MMETTRATLAQQFSDAMERKKRDGTPPDEGYFYTLKDGSPEWMQDAIREAHDAGGILPNDWIYDKIDTILSKMTDTDPDDWQDRTGEWADSCVDVYNGCRAAWLASNLSFGSIVDEAVEDLGHSDQGIYGDIGIGQYHFIGQIVQALIDAIEAQAEESDD